MGFLSVLLLNYNLTTVERGISLLDKDDGDNSMYSIVKK